MSLGSRGWCGKEPEGGRRKSEATFDVEIIRIYGGWITDLSSRIIKTEKPRTNPHSTLANGFFMKVSIRKKEKKYIFMVRVHEKRKKRRRKKFLKYKCA